MEVTMSVKRVFCAIFYILFTLLFTGLLICNITSVLNQFGIMSNNFFTNIIMTNVLTPIFEVVDHWDFVDTSIMHSILYIVCLVITLVFWFLCVNCLVNVLRNTSTKASSIWTIVLSIIMFIIFDAVVVMLVYNGATVAEVFQNYYLIGTTVGWLILMVVAIISASIKIKDDFGSDFTINTDSGMTAQEKEERVQQLLDKDIDPRV